MDEASICDIIGFIYNGDLITIDTPQELYKKHNTQNLEDIFIYYVKELSNKEVVSSFRDLKANRPEGGVQE
jgi:ABC-2 type transport system ATP-binding protein